MNKSASIFLLLVFLTLLTMPLMANRVLQDDSLIPMNKGVGITTPHHEVHEGDSYISGHYIDDLADTAALDLLIVTGLKEIHLTFDVSTEGLATVLFYEGTTVSAAGTGLAEINRDRTSSNTALTTVTHTPTVSGVGTVLIPEQLIPGGTGNKTVGTSRAAGLEFVLDVSTTHLLRITNLGGAVKDVAGTINWYEETP